MKIAICDDDIEELHNIKVLLEEYYDSKHDIQLFESGEKLLNCIERFELIFLDIQIGAESGIDVAAHIRMRNKRSNIIFISNYTDYFRQAFSVHAFQYLSKPIEREHLFKVLLDLQEYEKEEPIYEVFKTEKGIYKVDLNEVLYFEYADRKIWIKTVQKTFPILGTLREVESQVIRGSFVTPHRAFIVNLKKIIKIEKYDIYMPNDDIVPLAQKKAAAFKKKFQLFLLNSD